MTQREKEDEFSTEFSATDMEGEFGSGDIVTFTSDLDFQLSELSVEADEPNTFDVDVRDSDSTTFRRVKTKKGSSLDLGNFEDPVTEAGAQEEIAVRARNSASSGQVYITNVRVDRRRG